MDCESAIYKHLYNTLRSSLSKLKKQLQVTSSVLKDYVIQNIITYMQAKNIYYSYIRLLAIVVFGLERSKLLQPTGERSTCIFFRRKIF